MHHCRSSRTLKHKRNKPQNSSGQMEHVREAGTGCRLRANQSGSQGLLRNSLYAGGETTYFPQSDG